MAVMHLTHVLSALPLPGISRQSSGTATPVIMRRISNARLCRSKARNQSPGPMPPRRFGINRSPRLSTTSSPKLYTMEALLESVQTLSTKMGKYRTKRSIAHASIRMFTTAVITLQGVAKYLTAIRTNPIGTVIDLQGPLPSHLSTLIETPIRSDPHSPVTVFESRVDKAINALLSWSLPVYELFSVDPQPTYAEEVTNELALKIQADFSTETLQADESGFTRLASAQGWEDIDDVESNTLDSIQFDPPEASTPLVPKIGNPRFDTSDYSLPGLKSDTPSVLPGMTLDDFKRLVSAIGRRLIRRPDAVVTRGDKILIIVENKLRKKTEGVRQLQKYMTDLLDADSSALGMVCVLGLHGIEVAMFRRQGDDGFDWLGGDGHWCLANDPFVRKELYKVRQEALDEQ
ncbi:hypothetical protein DFH06DRAFT_1186361 [Mycena polygramma]|nr:hypothetical protein DFH06DRAFT_1186361 [Mycena polygramma]